MVECESGRVAQKWSSASRICEYIVLNINIFNVEYHAIIEIVECESGRVAQKWSSASRICEYRSTRSFTNSLWNFNNIITLSKKKLLLTHYLVLNWFTKTISPINSLGLRIWKLARPLLHNNRTKKSIPVWCLSLNEGNEKFMQFLPGGNSRQKITFKIEKTLFFTWVFCWENSVFSTSIVLCF